MHGSMFDLDIIRWNFDKPRCKAAKRISSGGLVVSQLDMITQCCVVSNCRAVHKHFRGEIYVYFIPNI